MLCRWEHDVRERPGPEYAQVITRTYGATLRQLGLSVRCGACEAACAPGPAGYGAWQTAPPEPGVPPMTTDSGLPAVRETLALAAADEPGGSATVAELAATAAEHYALNYSRHPPNVLFEEVRGARQILAGPLSNASDSATATELRRACGWLSGLLGNLAHHLGDTTGARAHLLLAAATGTRTGDDALGCWAHGALAMTAAAAGGDHVRALGHAEAGHTLAAGPRQRAQLLAWAQLPALIGLGRTAEAEQVLAAADTQMEAADEAPGRFGYDRAEHLLHTGASHWRLGHHRQAAALARESIAAKEEGSPGWAAAVLTLSLAEADAAAGDAAARALDVLDRIPAPRLRATSRARLAELGRALSADTAPVRDLRERLHVLPAPIDQFGRAAS
jgi:hypothetical protein